MRVRYSRRALSQLASVYEFLCERSPAGAHHVTESIKMTAARLEELPRLGKTTDESDVYLIVEPEFLYRIFYELRGDDVFVIRILHRAQDH
jgi:toxin ParE1/3/4